MRTAIALGLLGALATAPAFAAGYEKGQQQQSMGQVDQQTARQLQHALQGQGYNTGQIDGIWGPRSQQALRTFEQDRGLQADGQPDQQSLSALGVQGGSQQAQTPEERSQQQEQPQAQPEQQEQPEQGGMER